MTDVFWADQLASEAIDRAKRENAIVTCRSGMSTSGAKHIGNFFDITKAYIVHKAVLKKGTESRHILTHDDRDPMRTVPLRLPDLDGKWMLLDEESQKKIAKYLGYPYISIPDPFDCCESWARHFARVLEDGIDALGMKINTYSTNDLYNEGKFDNYIMLALAKIEASRRIAQRFQKTKKSDFIPFDVLCENCGRIIAKATGFDLERRKIKYECKLKALAGKYKIEGCGHFGEAGFRHGKLPWTFEWPAQWAMFSTTFEPFGKEHAEGSWKICQEVMKQVYEQEPPIPHIYEFLLINGEKMSARRGNAFIVQEMLEIMEPEVFQFLYTKRSKKQRNVDLKSIHLLIDEFDRAERIYFGAEEEKNETDKANIMRMYESSMKAIPEKIPVRIPYQLAVMISSMYGHDANTKNIAMAFVKTKISGDDIIRIDNRLALANNWIERVAPEMRIKINEMPDLALLSSKEKEALKDLYKHLHPRITEDEINTLLYDIAKKSGLGKDFFRGCYLALISEDHGPRLATFIMAISVERVKKILSYV